MNTLRFASLLVAVFAMSSQPAPTNQELVGRWAVTIKWISAGNMAITGGIEAKVIFAVDSSDDAKKVFKNSDVFSGLAEWKSLKGEPVSEKWLATIEEGKVLLKADGTATCVGTFQTPSEIQGDCLGPFRTKGKITAVREDLSRPPPL